MRASGVPHIIGKILTRAITCFRHHLNRTFIKNVMGFQNCENPKTKWHLGALWPATKNTVRGKVMVSPSLGRGESCESMFIHGSSVHQKCSNYALTNLLFGLCMSIWIIDLLVIFVILIRKFYHAPLAPKCCEPRSIPQLFILLFCSP
jgi:hypothetical protein